MSENVRSRILKEAEQAINGSRQHDYGSVESNFGMISGLWTVYTGVDIKPRDVAVMMQMVKISRIKSGHGKEDNWIDIAGYAACGAEVDE